MKYIVILGDGMADFPQPSLNGKTPLELANKPTVDSLSKVSEMGICTTVPFGLKPGSDVANLSVLGYNPKECYSGRSPLEAASIGITLKDTDVTARANLVTLSDEEDFENKTMIDYSSGEITTAEARELIEYLAKNLNNDEYKLYSGISYRHCLVIDNGKVSNDLTPPHDITGKKIKDYLPKTELGKRYLSLMKKSCELLKNHPINLDRKKRGLNPATSLWFWGEGVKPNLQNFKEKFGINGAMISAVDLLKGIGKLTGMEVIEVEGATGNYDTNFLGKAKACLKAIERGADFVYIHMEAPDECGHHGDGEHKIYSIEQISEVVVKTIKDELDRKGIDYSMLICPDHPTPISIMTHVSDPIPYLIYRSNKIFDGIKGERYTESEAQKTGIVTDFGYELMPKLLEK